jgi:hypothetical protein
MRFRYGALIAALSASALVGVGAPARAQDACGSLANERDIDRCLNQLSRDAGLPLDEPARSKPPAKAQAKAQAKPPLKPKPKPVTGPREAPAVKPPVRAAAQPVKTISPVGAPSIPTPVPIKLPPRSARTESSTLHAPTRTPPPAPATTPPIETPHPQPAPALNTAVSRPSEPSAPSSLTQRDTPSGGPWAILLAVIAALSLAGLAAWAVWRDHQRKAAMAAASRVTPIADIGAADEIVGTPDASPGQPAVVPATLPGEAAMVGFETAAPSVIEHGAAPIATPPSFVAEAPTLPTQAPGGSAIEASGEMQGEEDPPDRLGGLKTWLGASGFGPGDWRDLIISSARRVGARGYQALGEEERLVAALLDEAQTARSELFVAKQDKAELQDAISYALGDQARLIWPQPGEPFDPRRHQSYPEPPIGAQIANVQRAGFTSNGQIFRAYVDVTAPAD